MANNIEVPSVSYNTYFGIVNKVRWFDIPDQYQYFEIIFNVYRNQTKDTNLTLFNLESGNIWKRTVSRSSNPAPIAISDKILNVPGLGSPIYGAFNTYI
jgi:hypothetical protein